MEIVGHIAKRNGLTKTQTKELIDTLTELAKKEVKKNGEFTVPGIGKLIKTKRKARRGRNPATGQPINIPAKTTVKFRVSKTLSTAVGLPGNPIKESDPDR